MSERCQTRTFREEFRNRPLFHHLVGKCEQRVRYVEPHAFAVFRLSTNRKRVGCSTSRSAGLAPLKMRSTRAAERSKISRRSGPYDILTCINKGSRNPAPVGPSGRVF